MAKKPIVDLGFNNLDMVISLLELKKNLGISLYIVKESL